MTDQELKDLVAGNALAIRELKETQVENEKRFVALKAESDKQFAKTEAQIARTSEILSNVGHNNGDFAEYYFYNALETSKTFAGVTYDYVDRNVKQRTKRLQDEFDVVMYNGNSIALIECKYKAHENDLIKLVEKKVPHFRALNPDYANYTIYCGLASCSFYKGLEEQALVLGVAVLKQKGDVMEVNASTLRAY